MAQKPRKLLRARIAHGFGDLEFWWVVCDGKNSDVFESVDSWKTKRAAKRNAERVLGKLISVGWEWVA